MVKNKTGGNRHKKQARKNLNVPVSTKLRLAKEEGEIYAKVTKTFGGGMAEVICSDGVTRLLIIRRKFKGRNKRDNSIAIEIMVLVGKRLWEVVSDNKKQKVDLLYVYSHSQVEELYKKEKSLVSGILPVAKKKEEEEEETGFIITSKHDWKEEIQTLNSIPEKNVKITLDTIDTTDDIEWDDI